MAVAHRRLIAKAIAEFSHERILAPEPDGDGSSSWASRPPSGPAATRWSTGWSTRSLPPAPRRRRAPLDALAFVAGLAGTLGIPDRLVGTYLEEIAATLAGAAWKHHHDSSTPRRWCTPTSRRSRPR